MKQLLLFMVLALLSSQLSAEDKPCEPSVTEAVNSDRSRIKFLFFDCNQDQVPLKVLLRKSSEKDWKTVFEYELERFSSAAFGANMKDIDKDGFHDVEIITGCGNVNCTSEIYRLDSKSHEYYHYYSGSSDYNLENGYLISGSRSNCCQWVYAVYKIPDDRSLIDSAREEFIISVFAPEDGHLGDNGSKCKFEKLINGKYQSIKPPSNMFLKFCKPWEEILSSNHR